MPKLGRPLFFAALLTAGLNPCFSAAFAQAVLMKSDFEHSSVADNPWTCVDSAGHINAQVGIQESIDSSGSILKVPFGPNVATGDLNGDGLPDLVVADGKGFFWYFANSGTKTAPKFTTAELMPIWFGDPVINPYSPLLGVSDVIPHVQLVDLDKDGKLDLVVGTFTGHLYYVHNLGSPTQPVFRMPKDLRDISVNTAKNGLLWCNYLAPFLFDWTHTGRLDLTMGEGTYSANSIYLFANKGSNDKPIFSDETKNKIIPGLGREHLAPQVVDWNNDGKPDILTTEREGYTSIFLNTSATPDTFPPTFDTGHHVILGGKENLAQMTSVTVADLNGSQLPSLIIGSPTGSITYAQNTGKPGQPQFAAPVPISAVNDRPKIALSYGWTMHGAYGSPYDLLVCTNAKVEPGFTPPPDTTFTSALRFYIDQPSKPNPTFPEQYYPDEDSRFIQPWNNTVLMKPDVSYELSFWIRTLDDIRVRYDFHSLRLGSTGDTINSTLAADVDSSPAWSHFKTDIRFSTDDPKKAPVEYTFTLISKGKGSIYLDDVELIQRK